MIETVSGIIKIDDINIATVSRQHVRSRINGHGQDPLFVHGTTRSNLDPYNLATDEIAFQALSKVDLWNFIESKGGLDGGFDEEMLSHSQRQLFCLARAMLRNDQGRVVVLDEVTSSVDKKTDELMQRIIREKFKDHTIIAIAHRLHTIIDFDRVLVMDKGEFAEFDDPRVLLKKQSNFKELWETSSGRVRTEE